MTVNYGGREVQNNITKCETLLRSSRQIYILENIFTYHKTQLHGENTFTKDETNLHFRKQINKSKTLLPVPKQIYNDRFFTERECTTHRKWRGERCCCWWAR